MSERITEAGALSLIAVMREWWPPIEVTDATGTAWLEVIGDLSLDECVQAIRWIARNSPREFAPPPGVVRARAMAARSGPPAELPSDLPALPGPKADTMERVRQSPEYLEAKAAIERAHDNNRKVKR